MKNLNTSEWRLKPLMLSLCMVLLILSCCDDEGEPVDNVPPGEVSNFSVVAGDKNVILSWVPPTDSDVAGFKLTYAPDGPLTPLTLDALTASTAITGLVNGTSYTFTISVVDAAGNTSAGVKITGTPVEPAGILFAEDFEKSCTADGTPGGWVVFSAGSDKNWMCLQLVSGFSVSANGFGGSGASSDWLISPAITLEKNNSRILTFDYAVRFADAEGFGLQAKISTDYKGTGDPAAATWTTLNAGIKNTLNSDNQVASTPVSLSEFSGTGYIAFYYSSSGVASGQATRVTVNNVKVGSADSKDTFAPGNVSNLATEVSDGAVKLSWTAPTDADLAGYKLSYSPGGSTVTLAATVTDYTVSGLSNGTEYTISITSIDQSGNESSGAVITATPVPPPPTLFLEDFNTSCPAVGESPNAWVIFSAASTRNWLCSTRNGAYTIEINGYGGDAGAQDWLISPAITLAANNKYALTFNYSQRYADLDGFGLEARISTDYSGSGDPAAATWTKLEAGIAGTATDTPVLSSAVPLAAYSGKVYIAFYYTSSSGSSAKRVTVDNVLIAQ